MEIVIEPHTLQRAEERGTNAQEIRIVLEQGAEIPARGNRKAKAKVFVFKRERLGKYYEEKRVEVVSVNHKFGVVTASAIGFWADLKEKATKVATTIAPKLNL